jgi:O-acetyl-ADP-ribose deacetylase (regulator of RNase III)
MMDMFQVADEMHWTNPSVRALAGDADPLSVVTDRARAVLFAALDSGLTGPPFDPFALAKLLGLGLRARADVADARVGPAGDDEPPPPVGPLGPLLPAGTPLVVEYNPTRPRGRLRYSVAHEIAHALFPDVHQVVRHRTGTGAVQGYAGDDSWQLELLCNVAAAEFLMPIDAVAGLVDIDPDIDFLMTTRTRFDVSTEALLRRLAFETSRPLAVVAGSRIAGAVTAPLRVEYVVPSKAWAPTVPRGALLGPDGPFGEPTAVGQTARGAQRIGDQVLRAQTVGVPAYPGQAFPRVLGLVEPSDAPRTALEGIRYVVGDVAQPVGDGSLLIAHVVSDQSHSWSRRGVGRALAGRFPAAASAFHSWSIAAHDNLRLGNVHIVDVGQERPILVASMVAQRGFGPAAESRLVYQALAQTLRTVAERAGNARASVHLPRIGAGQAGGRWDLIEQEIERNLVRAGIAVTVYTPRSHPGRTGR